MAKDKAYSQTGDTNRNPDQVQEQLEERDQNKQNEETDVEKQERLIREQEEGHTNDSDNK